MARAALGITAKDLAAMSGASWSTIQRFESGADTIAVVRSAVRRAFEAEGIEFIEGGARRRAEAAK